MDRLITAFVDQWIPIVNHWLHLMSAILWIGSLGFLMMADIRCSQWLTIGIH